MVLYIEFLLKRVSSHYPRRFTKDWTPAAGYVKNDLEIIFINQFVIAWFYYKNTSKGESKIILPPIIIIKKKKNKKHLVF